MLSLIWCLIIVFSIILSFFTGKTEMVSNAAFQGAGDAVTLAIGLLGIMCFWNGLMNIAEKSGIVAKLSRLATPIFKLLFKGLKPDSPAGKHISMNLIANLLGLGNASTPPGLNAIRELENINPSKKTASNYMIMLVVLNTASFQIIPATLVAMRVTAGSAAPYEIITPIWIAQILALIAGIIMVNRKKHM